MLTGTPLDLTSFGAVLQGIGLLYWLLVIAALAIALWKPKRWPMKLLWVGIVLAVLVVPIGMYAMKRYEQQQQAKAKLDAAMALFEKDCKNAGEKITKTVDNVEGVVWMKWRDKEINLSDQFKMDDPYGRDCGGEDCIVKLLRATSGLELDPQKKEPHHTGFRFVESVDPKDGQLYRYTLQLYRPYDRDKKWLKTLIQPELLKVKIEKPSARYGITWDDISTHEDREKWIAGGSIKIIDLQTNEAIAERIGYMMDRGQGDQAGFRSPWGFAPNNACPEFLKAPGGGAVMINRANNFINKILRPTDGK